MANEQQGGGQPQGGGQQPQGGGQPQGQGGEQAANSGQGGQGGGQQPQGQQGGQQPQGGQGGQQNGEPQKKRGPLFKIILAVLVLAGLAFGIDKYIHGKHHEETDDAQIAANISPIIPRVSGYITEVRVKDNQPVKKGDTLVILDDRDLRLKVEQAEAALATAESNLGAARATTSVSKTNIATTQVSVDQAEAQIEAAKVNAWRATQDFNRYANLVIDHSITQQQYEQALAAKETADKQVQVTEAQKEQAVRQTHSAAKQSEATSAQIKIAEATIQQRKVDVDDAQLNLSYATITAPTDGLVSRVDPQVGQYITAGSQLFSVVLDSSIWVVANFKETQLERIQIGQRVIVHADAYSGHDFEAVVGSFSPATGAQFALLPPDNSSGNFVKVVQRLPVKILFDNRGDTLVPLLRPGMNVTVDVLLGNKEDRDVHNK